MQVNWKLRAYWKDQEQEEKKRNLEKHSPAISVPPKQPHT